MRVKGCVASIPQNTNTHLDFYFIFLGYGNLPLDCEYTSFEILSTLIEPNKLKI